MSLSVPQLVVAWLRASMEIEVKSLNYRVGKQQALIAYSKLLIFASTKLDIIIPIIRKSKDPKADLMAKLKISAEEAEQILELKLRQLSKLDQDAINKKLKEQIQVLDQLNKWLKAPKKKMILDVDSAMQAIKEDRVYIEKQKNQKLVLK